MDKIKDSLKSLDFFGEIPQLYTNETTQYQKELGGIITLMVLAIGIVGFIFFGQELWEKKIPTVNQSVMYDPSPDALSIDFNTFDFFIRLQDPSNIGFIDPSIYTVKGFINTVLPNGSFPSLEIDLEPCQNSSFTQENLDLFYPYNFNGSWCISKNQSKISLDEIRLEKSFGQIGFHMLIFKFYSCVNKTGGIKCANAEKMSTYLDNAYLALYTLDNFIQTNNFTYPTSKAVKNLFFTVSKNFYASTTLYYDRCVVTSDVGVMFSDSRNQESFTTNPLLTNINTSGSTKFASFALQLSNVKKLFFRKYMKLPEMIAQVGGLLQFVKICAVILYTNYNQHFYFQDLFNNFFSYKPNSENDSQSKKTNNNLNQSNTFKLVETTLKSNANNLENTTNLKNLSKTNPRNKSDIEDNINDKTEKNLSVDKSPKNQISKKLVNIGKNNFLEGQSLTKPNTRRASNIYL